MALETTPTTLPVSQGRRARPRVSAGRVLIALIIIAIALRVLVAVSWWPTTPTLDDGYQLYAHNPFLDPQHPAGYGLIVAAIGLLTRQVAVPVLIQHLTGIASALLLFGATRRITGSAWAALLPAGMVLLGGDQIFLEHAIMSESWDVLATSLGLYAAVRAMDEPEPSWRWPLLTGLALAIAVTIRTAGLLLIPVAVLALLLCRPRPLRHWRSPVTAAATAAVVLVGWAGANAAFGPRFGIDPSSGWYLYGRVAQFADCRRFTPPPGTAFLCDPRPVSQRPSGYDYMFDPQAAAPRHFGAFGRDDGLVGSWAWQALRAQPLDFLADAWSYLRSYYVPNSRPARLKSSTELDPQLDFTYGNPYFVPTIEASLEEFYDRFSVHARTSGLRLLHDWQRVFRFGATLLFITTLLTMIGLAIGPRRSRVGVLLFGVGGLSLLVAPVLTGTYSGRYTVPMAGPLMAAAAITITALWRSRRRAVASGAESPRRAHPGAAPTP